MPETNWRVLPLTVAGQQRHIEHSEQLLADAKAGEPGTLYWSQASPTGLVLGFSQKDAIINPMALESLGIPVYHRRAGGTAVLVGSHLLSLDVILPAGHPLLLADIVESYRWFGDVWVAAFARLGIATRAIPIQEARAQQALLKQEETHAREAILRRACYGSLSPYEVVVGQRKVVGLDMIRRRTGSLLQAGVLLQWHTELLARLLGWTPEEQTILREGLLTRAAGLDVLAGREVPAQEVVEAFQDALCTLL